MKIRLLGLWLMCHLFSPHVYAETVHYSAYFDNAIDVPQQQDYSPFVEEGKTWKYILRNAGVPDEEFPERNMILKIEDKIEKDGIEYFKLNQYIGDETTLEQEGTVCYLREDMETRQVWCLFTDECSTSELERPTTYGHPDGDILYDFKNPDNMAYSYGENEAWKPESHEFKCMDGSLRKAIDYERNDMMIAEGLGWLEVSQECNPDIKDSGKPGDIFGESMYRTSAAPRYWPYLYEIADGDGTVLYSREVNHYNAGIGNVATGSGCRIAQNGTTVTVTNEAGTVGEVSVVSVSGTVVRSFNIDSHEFAFNMEGYMPGTYIVKAGTETLKIAVN